MMTLRQVEVIRAVMITGTIGGAAKLLNVSAPGISRLVKYTERVGRLPVHRRRGRMGDRRADQPGEKSLMTHIRYCLAQSHGIIPF